MILYTYLNGIRRVFLLRTVVCTAFLLSCTLFIATAQAQTPAPHITIDGSLEGLGGSAFQAFTENSVEITQEMGVTIGGNLLHSFGQFNLPTEYGVTFSGDPGIANVLSRVTGGGLSSIDGVVASTIPGANLFLMNPAGVLFGPNASLDISGSFYVTTADRLSFGDGTALYANPASDDQVDSILQVSPIEAFGFLGDPTHFGFTNETANARANITVSGNLGVDPGNHMSLVGRDTNLDGELQGGVNITAGMLEAPGGKITLVSVAAQQEGPIDNIQLGVNGQNFQAFNSQGETIQEPVRLGDITLSQDAEINASGDGGGTIVIRGGQLTVDGSSIAANTTGPENGPLNHEPGQGIDIRVTGDVRLDNESAIATNVLENVARNVGSGGVRVMADHVEIANDSIIESNVEFESTGGKSGDIEVEANSLIIRDISILEAGTEGFEADGGNISLNVNETLEVRDGGAVSAFTDVGSGDSGDIAVDAQNLLLSGGAFGGNPEETNISSESLYTGNAGNIRIEANQLQIFDAEISSSTEGEGNAGNLRIDATQLRISDGEISTFTEGEGSAGDINIDAQGGDIFLTRGLISANTVGNGNGGLLNLIAHNLELTNHSTIQAATVGDGDARGVNLTVTNNFELHDASTIVTQTGAEGNAGDLTIDARNISITGISESRNPTGNEEATGLSATTLASANGGNILITGENLTIQDKGLISASADGTGKAGDITINLSENLVATNGAQILANTTDSGDAGIITISSHDILLSGANPVPISGSDVPFPTAITSVTFVESSGRGGNISLEALNDLTIEDGAGVSAESRGEGNAGSLDLKSGNTILVENSLVTTEAQDAFAGDIKFEAGNLIQVINSNIISEVPEGSGSAGRINIDPQFIVVQGSRIDSSANFGDGGDVTFVADSAILIDPFSTIDTSSRFGGSGTVDIRAPIQNLGEAIAPLPEEILKVSGLFAARCAAQKGGNFSSLSHRGRERIPFEPGDYLSTPGLHKYGKSLVSRETLARLSTDRTTTGTQSGNDDTPKEREWKSSSIPILTRKLSQDCSQHHPFPS